MFLIKLKIYISSIVLSLYFYPLFIITIFKNINKYYINNIHIICDKSCNQVESQINQEKWSDVLIKKKN
jgi:hypothetical protein